MRLNDLSDGSIKTLLILVLLVANIAVALPHRRVDSQPPGSVRASSRDRGIFGAFAQNYRVAQGSLARQIHESNSFRQSPLP
jgi:hypothetical protein